MLKVLRLFLVLAAAAALALLVTPTANAQQPATFVAELSPEPTCTADGASDATGFAFVSINEASGRITYRVVAFNLPGTIAGSPGVHIHRGPATGTGPVVLGLDLTGENSGVVASGTTVNPTLAAAIIADPANYYVNVHTTECGSGAIRGQLVPVVIG
jgi:hypothetical protein